MSTGRNTRRPGRHERGLAELCKQIPADLEMTREPGARDERNRSFAIAEPRARSEVDIVGGCETLIDEAQCVVEVGTNQPVENPSGSIPAQRGDEIERLRESECRRESL